MRKVEAATLEEAYEKASKMLNCSVSELQSEVIQHPSKGILGFLKKSAIIVATCKKDKKETQSSTENKKSSTIPTPEESVASEIIATIKERNSMIKNSILKQK